MKSDGAAQQEQSQASRLGALEIAREVRQIIADRCGRSVESITPDLSLEGGLGVDSLTMIELNVALEERFQIVAPDFASPDELPIRTVGDVIAFVEAQVAARAGRGGAS